MTTNNTQMMFTPEQTCLEYGRKRYLWWDHRSGWVFYVFPFNLEDEGLYDLDFEQCRFIGRARHVSIKRNAREMAAGNSMQKLCANKLVGLCHFSCHILFIGWRDTSQCSKENCFSNTRSVLVFARIATKFAGNPRLREFCMKYFLRGFFCPHLREMRRSKSWLLITEICCH